MNLSIAKPYCSGVVAPTRTLFAWLRSMLPARPGQPPCPRAVPSCIWKRHSALLVFASEQRPRPQAVRP